MKSGILNRIGARRGTAQPQPQPSLKRLPGKNMSTQALQGEPIACCARDQHCKTRPSHSHSIACTINLYECTEFRNENRTTWNGLWRRRSQQAPSVLHSHHIQPELRRICSLLIHVWRLGLTQQALKDSVGECSALCFDCCRCKLAALCFGRCLGNSGKAAWRQVSSNRELVHLWLKRRSPH